MTGVEGESGAQTLEDALARLDGSQGLGKEELQARQEAAETLYELADEHPQEVAERGSELLAAIEEEFSRDYADVEIITIDFESRTKAIISMLLGALSTASNEDRSVIAESGNVDLFLDLDAKGFTAAMWCLKNVSIVEPELVEPAVERVLEAMQDGETGRARGAMLCASYLVERGVGVERFADNIDVPVEVLASATDDDPGPGNRDRTFAAKVVRNLATQEPETVMREIPALVTVLPECEDEARDDLVGTVQELCSRTPDAMAPLVEDVLEVVPELDPDNGGELLSALTPIASSNQDAIEPVFDDAETYLVDADGPVFVGAVKLFDAAEKSTIDAAVPHVEAVIGRLDAQEERVESNAAKLLSLIADARPEVLSPYVERLRQISQSKSEDVEDQLKTTIAKSVYTSGNPEWFQVPTDNTRIDLDSAKWQFGKIFDDEGVDEIELERERAKHDLEDTLDWVDAVERLEDDDAPVKGECEPVLHTFLESPEGLETHFDRIVDHLVDGPEVNIDLVWLLTIGIPYWESRAEELVGEIGPLFERTDGIEFFFLFDFLEEIDEYRHDVVVEALDADQETFQRLCRFENLRIRSYVIGLIGAVLCEPGDHPAQVEPYLDIFADQTSDDSPWIRGLVAENLKDIADHHPELLVEYVPDIAELLTDSDVGARSWGHYVIGKLASFDPESVGHVMDTVVGSFDHYSPDIRVQATYAFQRYADARPDAVTAHLDELMPCVRDRELEVRKATHSALVRYMEEYSAEPFAPYTDILATTVDTPDDDLMRSTTRLLAAIAASAPDRFVEQTDGEELYDRVRDGGFPSNEVGESFSRLVALHQIRGTLSVDTLDDATAREEIETWLEDGDAVADDGTEMNSDEEERPESFVVGRGAVELPRSHPLVESKGGASPELDPSAVTTAMDASTAAERREATAACQTLCEERPDEIVRDGELLEARLRDVNAEVRRFALFALCELRSDHFEMVCALADAVADQLHHPDAEARAAACILLRTAGGERLGLLRKRAGDIASVVHHSNHPPTISNGTAILGILARNGVRTNAPIDEAIAEALSNQATTRVGAVAFRDYVTSGPNGDSFEGSDDLLQVAVEVFETPANRKTDTLVSVLKGLQYIAEREPASLTGQVPQVATILGSPYAMSETVERLAIDVLRRVAREEPESITGVVETISVRLENVDVMSKRHELCIETLHRVATETSNLDTAAVKPLVEAVDSSDSSMLAADVLWEIMTKESSLEVDREGAEALIPHFPKLMDALEDADDELRWNLLRITICVNNVDNTLLSPYAERLLTCLESSDEKVLALTINILISMNVDPSILAENVSRIADAVASMDESDVVDKGLLLLLQASRTDPSTITPELETIVDLLDSDDFPPPQLAAHLVVVAGEEDPGRISDREVEAMFGALVRAEDDDDRNFIARSLKRLSSALPEAFSGHVDRIVDYLQAHGNSDEIEPARQTEYRFVATVLVSVIEADVSAVNSYVTDLVSLRKEGSTVQREATARILGATASKNGELLRAHIDELAEGVWDDSEPVRKYSLDVLRYLAEDDPEAALEHADALLAGLNDASTDPRLYATFAVNHIADERPAAVAKFRDAVVSRLEDDDDDIAQKHTEILRKSMTAGGIEPDRHIVTTLSRERDSQELTRERTRTLAVAASLLPELVSQYSHELDRLVRNEDDATMTCAIDGLGVLPTESSLGQSA